MNRNTDSDASGGVGTQMDYPILPLPKPQVGASHPFKNEKNHQKLLEYIQQRLMVGKVQRDGEVDRLVAVDKAVAGWMKLDDGDKERANKQNRTGTPAATKLNLPLTYVHIDDMMTYFAATFAPTRGMFYHTGKQDETTDSTQIITIMNNHAIYAGYYREVLLGILSLLKYNSGGFYTGWQRDHGPKLVRDESNEDKLESELKWEGNKLEALDKYNFLCDPSVHPNKLYCDGEFGARVKMVSHYWLQSRAVRGSYYNCEEALTQGPSSSSRVYYRSPPREAQFESNASNGTDWVSVLGQVDTSGVSNGYEHVEIFMRLNPVDFGLIDGTAAQKNSRRRYETWRFTLINNEFIVDATYMNNIHGFLPFFMGVINDDVMGSAQKSTAEILAPLQNFASFLINTHITSSRKNMWGLTIYDPSVIDLKEIPEGEVAARIAMKPSGYGKNVNEAVWQPTSRNLDTSQTMQDLGGVIEIINQFFPTQSLPGQIASIDRAVTSQVAAVQQGVNRRQQKSARLIDDSIFRPLRFAMYYNIIQYQPDESEVTDYYTGKPVQINLNSLRNTDLPFIIGQGLKSVDRQTSASELQKVIFALIQAPQSAQGIDLLGMIDYWTSMLDVDIDMKQFRLAPPAPEGGAPAVDPATGAPIQPATNPAAVTTPIYGS